MSGKFIVIYASNNLGKSEQIKQLGYSLVKAGKNCTILKYPVYGLQPTGQLINAILRHPEKLHKTYDELELQMQFAENRRQFQPTLVSLLRAGIHVLAEDYTGTSIAWGMTKGVEFEELERINKDLLVPDISILLDGERFTSGREEKHRNEGAGDEVWTRNRQIHRDLAERYKWTILQANQPVDTLAKQIADIVLPVLE